MTGSGACARACARACYAGGHDSAAIPRRAGRFGRARLDSDAVVLAAGRVISAACRRGPSRPHGPARRVIAGAVHESVESAQTPGLIRTLWFWRRAASSALRAGAAQAGPTDPRDVSSPARSTSPRSPRRPRARRPVLGAAATPAALMLKSKHILGIVSSVKNYVSTG